MQPFLEGLAQFEQCLKLMVGFHSGFKLTLAFQFGEVSLVTFLEGTAAAFGIGGDAQFVRQKGLEAGSRLLDGAAQRLTGETGIALNRSIC